MSDNIIQLPEVYANGVIKKKEANPTNWQFSEHPMCMATEEKALPVSFSIKEKFPPAYKQPCGNCTSNAVLACDAYYYHTDAWIPSTIFTYYNQRAMIGQKDKKDTGSCVETALDAVRKYGACNSTIWSNSKPFYKKPSKAAFKDGLKGHEIVKYYQVKSQKEIKKALYKGYPVAIAMRWAFTCIDGNSWIFIDPSDDDIEDCTSGHALVIVGYDDESRLFEVRNSWGSNWGNNGYAYITYDAMKKLIWYEDSYAIIK